MDYVRHALRQADESIRAARGGLAYRISEERRVAREGGTQGVMDKETLHKVMEAAAHLSAAYLALGAVAKQLDGVDLGFIQDEFED